LNFSLIALLALFILMMASCSSESEPIPTATAEPTHKWSNDQAIAFFQTWASVRPSPQDRTRYETCWDWATGNRNGRGAAYSVHANKGDQFDPFGEATGSFTKDYNPTLGVWFVYTFSSDPTIGPVDLDRNTWLVFEDTQTVSGSC
jgi:hypothetical protein